MEYDPFELYGREFLITCLTQRMPEIADTLDVSESYMLGCEENDVAQLKSYSSWHIRFEDAGGNHRFVTVPLYERIFAECARCFQHICECIEREREREKPTLPLDVELIMDNEGNIKLLSELEGAEYE